MARQYFYEVKECPLSDNLHNAVHNAIVNAVMAFFNFDTMRWEWKKVRKRIRAWKVPVAFRNKYVFTAFIFIAWMLFFDQNNFFVQMERYDALRDAKNKAEYYLEETEIAKQQLNELLTNDRTLEKFAREKYYMKKANEDVFVIVND